jgi:flagellar M-ring protein FliF
MKEISKQLIGLWHEMKRGQRGALIGMGVALIGVLCLVWFKSSATHWVPLTPGKTLLELELENIEACLLDAAIPYRVDPNNEVLVEKDQLAEARSKVTNLHKGTVGVKGFELFDSNTWIKGEKELQVLEIRALKGQLEKDLAAYENIKSAHVILDIPPQKTFNNSKFQAKASVILTLMPKENLSVSQLRAITNHLAGAVRGLEPHMIAISDTTGKLYKAIDLQGEEDPLYDPSLLFEERVEGKLAALLSHLVGEGHFHLSVQAVLDKQTESLRSLSVVAFIDANWIGLRQEIEQQLTAVTKGYSLETTPTIDFIPFDKERKGLKVEQEIDNRLVLICAFAGIAILLLALIPFLRRVKEKPKCKDEEAIFKLMSRIDLKKLAQSLNSEDPEAIALMLSYLEPVKAEEMLAALNPQLQEEVLFHLSELEKGELS